MRKIGFIGIGKMGNPMAKNLLKAGFSLIVYDLAEDSVRDLVRSGAIPASSPKELAHKSDVIIFMVPDTIDVEKALFGMEGAIEGIRDDSAIIVMSTILPLSMRTIAQKTWEAKKSIRIMDAPVVRAQKNAVEGTLGILVGGAKEILTIARIYSKPWVPTSFTAERWEWDRWSRW